MSTPRDEGLPPDSLLDTGERLLAASKQLLSDLDAIIRGPNPHTIAEADPGQL